MSEYFIFDGIDSRDFGIYVINNGNQQQLNLSPSKSTTSEKIAGRDGSLIFDQTYDGRQIPIRCEVKDSSLADLRTIMSWLGKKGAKSLVLSYEEYKEYLVTFEEDLKLNNFVNGATFTINFKAYNSFAKSRFTTLELAEGVLYNSGYYYDSGVIYGDNDESQYQFSDIQVITDIEVYNGSNVDGSRPNIIIDGSASSLEITQWESEDRNVVKNQCSYGSFNGTLEINCLEFNTFLDGNVDNATFSGDYFELDGKTSLESVSNGILESVGTSTVTLPDHASDVDDFYNGMAISIKNLNGFVMYSISDYDGTTHEATISSSFLNEPSGGDDYIIYDVIHGNNYFTIDGSNLNLNTVTFDFKFLYL